MPETMQELQQEFLKEEEKDRETQESVEEPAPEQEVEAHPEAVPPDDLTVLKKRFEDTQRWGFQLSEQNKQLAAQIKAMEDRIRQATSPPPPRIELNEHAKAFMDTPGFQEAAGHMIAERARALMHPYAQRIEVMNEAMTRMLTRLAAKEIESVHPDWNPIVQSEEWGRWVESQPPAYKQMLNSYNPEDTNFLLREFKKTKFFEDVQKKTQVTTQQRKTQQAAAQTVSGGMRGVPKRQATSENPEDILKMSDADILAINRRAKTSG